MSDYLDPDGLTQRLQGDFGLREPGIGDKGPGKTWAAIPLAARTAMVVLGVGLAATLIGVFIDMGSEHTRYPAEVVASAQESLEQALDIEKTDVQHAPTPELRLAAITQALTLLANARRLVSDEFLERTSGIDVAQVVASLENRRRETRRQIDHARRLRVASSTTAPTKVEKGRIK